MAREHTSEHFISERLGTVVLVLITIAVIFAQHSGFTGSYSFLILGILFAALGSFLLGTERGGVVFPVLLGLLLVEGRIASERLPSPTLFSILRRIQHEQYDELPYHHWRVSEERFKFLHELRGVVEELPQRDSFGSQLVTIGGEIEGEKLTGRVNLGALPWEEYLSIGDSVTVECRFSILDSELTEKPELRSFHDSLRRRGISLLGEQCSLSEHTPRSGFFRSRDQFIEALTVRFGGGDPLGVVLASVLGVRGAVSAEAEDLFRRSGTTHLVVVSGFHIGVISLLLQRIFEFFYRRAPRLVTLCPVQVVSPFFALGGAGLYTLLTGSDLSAVRALVTAVLLAILSIVSRKGQPLRLVVIAVLLMTTLFPGSLLEPGCQLTFAALLGLILGEKWYRRLTDGEVEAEEILQSERWRIRRILRRHLLQPLSGCIGAFIATAPVVLYWFQGVAPLSWGINLLFIPIFTGVCILLAGAAVFMLAISAPGAELITNVTLWLTSQLLYLLRGVTGLLDLLGLGVVTNSPAVFICSILILLAALAPVILPRPNRSDNLSAV